MNEHVLIEESKTFESILACQKDLLSVRAWRVTYCLIALCIILSLMILALLVKHDKEVVLIRVDNTTGYAEVMSKVSEEELTSDEALGKFFVSRYISLREQYIYGSLQEDYRLVQLYSDSSVQKDYVDFFDAAGSPDQVYGEDFAVKIEIVSINLSSGTLEQNIATVRFKKAITDLRNHKTKEEYYSARLVFDFSPEEAITDKKRLDNPLGFKVSSYQVTPELN